MDVHFQDIAGLITDGSNALDAEGLGSMVASGAPDAAISLGQGDEFALMGISSGPEKDDQALNGASASFFLARGTATGPFDQWRATKSISQFGESGTGAWAAARSFPESQRFWLARDQFGQQPLYYAEKGGATAFATNLNWFFASGFMARKFNAEFFSELVQLQFLSGSSTAYEGIRRVFPGETIVIERGRIVDRLRRPTVPLSDRVVFDRAAAVDALDGILNGAVSKALEGPRLLGCVITGDLASTVVAVAIARRAKRRVRAYIPVTPEGGKAAQTAAIDFAKGLGFEPVPLNLDEDAFFKMLPGLVAAMPDPIGDQAALIWQAVARAAKTDGACLILPTGGQELFGAYGRYRTAARPLWLGGRAMRSRGHLQGLSGLPEGPSHWRDGLTGVENRLRGSSFTRIQNLQLLDISTWLPNDTLLGEHQIFAAERIKARRPFLEPEIAAYAFSLSDRLKLRGSQGGVLLHHWLAKTYPTAADFLAAPRVGVPLADWIGARCSALAPAVETVMAGGGFLPEGNARELINQLASRKAKRLGMAAWQLLYFALWYRIHIDGADSEGDIETVLSQGI